MKCHNFCWTSKTIPNNLKFLRWYHYIPNNIIPKGFILWKSFIPWLNIKNTSNQFFHNNLSFIINYSNDIQISSNLMNYFLMSIRIVPHWEFHKRLHLDDYHQLHSSRDQGKAIPSRIITNCHWSHNSLIQLHINQVYGPN